MINLEFWINLFSNDDSYTNILKMKKNRPSTASDRANSSIKEEAKRKLQNCSDPVEKLRCFCLTRGATGILGLGR